MKMKFILIRCLIFLLSLYVVLAISPYEESQFFADREPERMIVVIISRLGLANRLRSLADWYQIASMSGRTLLVSWQPTTDCNAKFTDLFIDGPQNFRVLPEHVPAGDKGIEYLESIARKHNISNRPIYLKDMDELWVNRQKAFIISKDVFFSNTEVVMTHYDGIISLEGVQCQQYMMLHSQFLSRLVPNIEAQNFINTLRNEHFANRIMVGVHFRAHDPLQDWAVVPPFRSGSQAELFGAGTSVQDFLEVMNGIQNAFLYTDHNGDQRTHVRFFVASNNETEKHKFQQAVPGGVFLSGDYRRDTEEGMQMALLEWLALSESALLVNTYGSSFAEQAAQVHRRPIVGLWDGHALHHSSMTLPYCGHMQFVKAYSRQGQRSVYTEGTADNRKVKYRYFIYLCFQIYKLNF